MLKVMLDPGHGGGKAHNRGFKQIDNLPYCNEGDCNFIYAKDYLKPALEKYGIIVGLTRSDIWQNPTLAARGAMARGYDLLLSCHSNAAGGSATGTEIWDSTNPKESIKDLTDKLCTAISSAIGTNNRGTKYRKNNNGSNYYGVLRNGLARHNFIIEHAFHDNYADCKKYVDNLDKVAKVTAKTIAEYFGLSKSESVTKTPILSKPTANLEQMKIWAKSKSNNLEFIGLADLYWRLAQTIGIDPVVAYVQMSHETGFLYKIKSAAGLDASFHNPCGLKITQGGGDYQASAHKKFLSWQDGIMAHLDHLALYAGATGYPKSNTNDPRHFKYLLGSCKYVEDLGGKWAPGKDYGYKLLNYISEIRSIKVEKKVEEKEHWAEKYWKDLSSKGIEIHEERFDDFMTRGEVFALLDRIIQKLNF
ncbi:N-acetylmuramoyl-L-alanine amidase [Peptoniphilus sp. ING2-D1G]|nr:N-acetylmuramoyl-L-alanine amidase [Peptoniphilus sp. ING2-D1G]